MKIALDAMGADNAPEVEVEGAARATHDHEDLEVLLVGDEARLTEELAKHPKHGHVRIVHAAEVIGMSDSPVEAVRGKKQSSLLVAMRLVKEGEADAVVSAGNTGAVMVASRVVLGALRGVSRSAICQAIPTSGGSCAMLDLGANVDSTARHLTEFAEMGIAYSTHALGVSEPRVGLLNIGEEESKGGTTTKEVHRLLRQAPHVNFIGNVEPKAIYEGAADVVVCDGFAGNLFLKTSEAAAMYMGGLLKEKLTSTSMSKIGAMLARKALNEIRSTVDPNQHPGAPLLGVNGISLILHGSATWEGVKNAIVGARVAFENRLNDHIRENIDALRAISNGEGQAAAS